MLFRSHRMLRPGGILEIIVPHYTTAGDHNFRHHSHFSTGAIKDFIKGNEAQNELMLQGTEPTFTLIKATRKLRGLHFDVPGYIFDFVPVWDSIHWIVKKDAGI